MTGMTHHIPDNLLIAYASGALPAPYALVVAAHVSMCDDARARLEAHNTVGGALISQMGSEPLSGDLKARIFDQLGEPFHAQAPIGASGVFPAPVMQALNGKPPKWKRMGLGTRQSIISHDAHGSVRLLYIPPGQAVPDHGHGGLELTLVLQGAFRDETGRYGVGDLEVADDDLEHTPIAEEGEACICLAATDEPLRFRSMVPRLLQPIFRI